MKNKTLYNTALQAIQAFDDLKIALNTLKSEINQFQVASAYGIDGLKDVIDSISKTITNLPFVIAEFCRTGKIPMVTPLISSIQSLKDTLHEYRTKGTIPYYKKQELLNIINSSIQRIDSVLPDLIKQKDENYDAEESQRPGCRVS